MEGTGRLSRSGRARTHGNGTVILYRDRDRDHDYAWLPTRYEG